MRGGREWRLTLCLPDCCCIPELWLMSDSGSELAFTAAWDSVSKVIKLKDREALWKMRDKG